PHRPSAPGGGAAGRGAGDTGHLARQVRHAGLRLGPVDRGGLRRGVLAAAPARPGGRVALLGGPAGFLGWGGGRGGGGWGGWPNTSPRCGITRSRSDPWASWILADSPVPPVPGLALVPASPGPGPPGSSRRAWFLDDAASPAGNLVTPFSRVGATVGGRIVMHKISCA